MRRGISRAETYSLISEIRRIIPGIALRTSLMVGYPGESEDDFRQLKNFVAETRFDRLGVFIYSEEEGTYAAANEKDTVPGKIKEERFNELMELQRNISLEKNLQKVGQTMKVIIDRQEGDHYIGRTEYDSPEVDNEVIIFAGHEKLVTGEFCDIVITGAEEYDLYAGITGSKGKK
jgi:ribosomal protein S12 methylthiotransferase